MRSATKDCDTQTGINTTLPHLAISITATGLTPGTVDLLVIQLGMNEKSRTDDDLIFFNAPASKEGAVTLSGDRVDVSPDRVPSDVHFLRVAVALDESAGGTLAAIKVSEPCSPTRRERISLPTQRV